MNNKPTGQAVTDAHGRAEPIINGRVAMGGIVDPTIGNMIAMAYDLIWRNNVKPDHGDTADDRWKPTCGNGNKPVHGVTRTFTGGTAVFATPGDWTPYGVPVSGDTAIIKSGGDVTVNLGTATGVNFWLQGGTVEIKSGGSYSIGALRGSGVVYLVTPGQTALVTTTGIQMSGGSITVDIYPLNTSRMIVHGDSSLTNGAMLATQNLGDLQPAGPFENDGTMTVDASTMVVGTLTGHGVIRATGDSTVSVIGTSAGETIQLLSAHLNIGSGAYPAGTGMQFLGAVTHFGADSSITIDNTQATREVFTKSSPTAGELFLYNGSTMVADLHISGQASIFASNSSAGLGGSVLLTAYDTGHSIPITG